MFLESHPIVATKSSSNGIHFSCHSMRPSESDKCKQIQSPSSEIILFVFFLPHHPLGLFVLILWFSPFYFSFFLVFFFPTPFLFCFHIYFIHPPFILSYFIPPFIFFLLWFLAPFLFCFSSYFVFALCFFPFFYCSHPPFSFFLLLALFFLPLLSLANIFPLFLLLLHALPPIAFLGNWKNSVAIELWGYIGWQLKIFTHHLTHLHYPLVIEFFGRQERGVCHMLLESS